MIAFAKKAFWRVCFGCGEWFSTARKEGCYCRVCHSENLQRPRRTVRFCAVCKKPFIPKAGRNAGKCCSRECGFVYYRQWHEETRANHPHSKVSVITCEVCGKVFVGHGSSISASVCSDDCRMEQARRKTRLRKHGREGYSHGVVVCACGRVEVFAKWFRGSEKCVRCKKRDAKRHRKHIKRTKNGGEQFTLRDVFDRDHGRCQLCRRKVTMPTGKWSKRMATIDHIVPVTKGGNHTLVNVQLCCAMCNSEKNDSTKGQLRLIG
jgi:hypothetical protein